MCKERSVNFYFLKNKTSNKFSLTADPGWNDPPMLNYSPDNPPPKSRITNKRVAFPLSSTAGPTGSSPSSYSFSTVPVPGDQLQRILENFRVLISEVDVSEQLELQQKLEQLKNCWTEGVLQESVKKYVYDISDCLCKKDVAKANEIQLKLVMEHGSVCGSWIGLIRRLSAVMQTKN